MLTATTSVLVSVTHETGNAERHPPLNKVEVSAFEKRARTSQTFTLSQSTIIRSSGLIQQTSQLLSIVTSMPIPAPSTLTHHTATADSDGESRARDQAEALRQRSTQLLDPLAFEALDGTQG
jgi:hypothetical protein